MIIGEEYMTYDAATSRFSLDLSRVIWHHKPVFLD